MSEAAPHSMPEPPAHVVDAIGPEFAPSHELAAWVMATFVEQEGPLTNADHAHLATATLGFLFTNAENVRRDRRTLGRAALGLPSGSDKWSKALKEWQLRRWFGFIPDFLITLDAAWFAEADAWSRCALIEHELYHCGQDTDEFGSPKFSRNGPVWAMRPHDLEEFTGVVARYGAWSDDVAALVSAANDGPSLGRAAVGGACGTCNRPI